MMLLQLMKGKQIFGIGGGFLPVAGEVQLIAVLPVFDGQAVETSDRAGRRLRGYVRNLEFAK
jgi:hypothetical protein